MKRVFVIASALMLTLTMAVPAGAVDQVSDRSFGRELPESVEALQLNSPINRTVSGTVLDNSLVQSTDSEQVIIRLAAPAVAETGERSRAARSKKRAIEAEQADLLETVLALDPDAQVLGQVQLVLNAVFVEVDGAVLQDLASDPRVARIAPVGNYELDLTDTVPYIGGAAVQAGGVDGSGIKVAVLDSGVDYTHASLGGDGTLEAYAAAYGEGPFPNDVLSPANKSRDGLFPTARVVDGYDFVGELWPDFGPLDPDPDPIDFEGHGTHVADIIGGVNGVAPGVDLYAVKVCASLSSSCSGVALIQGMEFSVDPDGDGDPADAVDIINMSLGSNYGQVFDDDLSAAVESATAFGVLTVSSAGNGSNKPYVQGSPSGAPTAISVAQTAVPSAVLPKMRVIEPEAAAGLYDAAKFAWSGDLVTAISGPATYVGSLAGVDSRGCDLTDGSNPYIDAGVTLSGIVMVDRGACRFDEKILNLEEAGAELGIVGLVTPEDPFAGGGDPIVTIPGFMISQADGNIIRAGGAVVSFDPADGVPLIGSVIGSSSRGPNFFDHAIKPEIGAPGASVSAEVGTGTGNTPFGGTSGASPMVAGSAALLLDGYGVDLSPLEVKALLVNNAETTIYTSPGGELAPIARIGGGEVRVDRAMSSPTAAWAETPSGTLSLGYVDVAGNNVQVVEKVTVKNYSNERITYDITPTFRYQNDADNGAVSVSASPSTVKLGPGQTKVVTVQVTIDGSLLRGNSMNSGSGGTNPGPITLDEYDGYLVFSSDEHTMHMPWHVLPRQAADVNVEQNRLNFNKAFELAPELAIPSDEVSVRNNGAGIAQNDAFSLVALSEDIPEGVQGGQAPVPDLRAVGVNTFPVPAGFCSAQDSFIWAFAMNTHERQSHLLPVIHFVDLDIDQDGEYDYEVFNAPASYPALGDERELTWALNLATGEATAFFFAEHSTNTANTVLYICGEQVGLTGTDMLATNVDMAAGTFDYYFGGSLDIVEGVTVTPLGEQYVTLGSDIAAKDSALFEVLDFGPFPGNTPELGVLLLTNGDRGSGARGGATEDTEALIVPVKGVDVPRSFGDDRVLPGYLAN